MSTMLMSAKKIHTLLPLGFSMIELLIVFSIIAVLSGIGFVGIRGYTEQRTLVEGTKDFSSALQTARSRAQTQVKPKNCTGPLDGYKMKLTCSQTACMSYEVIGVCGGQEAETIISQTIPEDVTLTPPFSQEMLFSVLTGSVQGVANENPITFTARSGAIITITVFQDGRITNETR